MTETTDPVRRSVVVPCEPAKAFALFTDEIDRWWPTATHSVGDDDCIGVGVEPRVGGRIVEQLRSGQEATWGTVTVWDPPREVAMTWHPGHPADRATDVRVTFSDHAGGTLVELVHSGWERLADGARLRANYDSGWMIVLTPYAETAGASRDDVA